MHGEYSDEHLSVEDVATFVDRQMAEPARARVESHLATCAECREEVVAVTSLARSPRARWWWTLGVPLAAAAMLLLAIVPRTRAPAGDGPVLREPAVTTTVAPAPRAPIGAVASLPPLSWTRVPHADRYRVTVFDTGGAVVWETQVGDTSAAIPDSVSFQPLTAYFWNVAARTGWDRWVASDLVSFTLGASGGRR